jgi:hypothetical protein
MKKRIDGSSSGEAQDEKPEGPCLLSLSDGVFQKMFWYRVKRSATASRFQGALRCIWPFLNTNSQIDAVETTVQLRIWNCGGLCIPTVQI